MRLLHRRPPPCDEIGHGLIARIAALQPGPRVLNVRWLWLTDWLMWKRRRRGVPVA